MKVLEHEHFNEISDYINNITNCIGTAKKLLLVLDKQRDTLKESLFKYMVKEVRYELLELVKNMGKHASVDTQKDTDDIERDVFMVSCETMIDELKTVGIREEWAVQQKHMGEVQNLICQVNQQMSLYNSHYFTQSSVLIGIFSKTLEDGAVEQILASTDLLELLQTIGNNFYSIFSLHIKECTGTSNSECYKCALAICTTAAFISSNSKGRQYLLTSCPHVIQRFITSLPLINDPPTKKIKLVLLELFMNLAENAADLVCMKNFCCVFDNCLNQDNQCKEVVKAALELLNKVIYMTENVACCEHFLNELRQCITVGTLQKHVRKQPKLKSIAEAVAAKLKSAGHFKIPDSNICVKVEINSCNKLPASNWERSETSGGIVDETFTICACSSPRESDITTNDQFMHIHAPERKQAL